MIVNVKNGGDVSETFAITNGDKQGYVLVPTLFSIFLIALLDEAFRDMGDGVYNQSCQNSDPLQFYTSEQRQKPQIYSA